VTAPRAVGRPSKAALVNSETVQGLTLGTGMGGTGVTGLEEPTWGVYGARTTCAWTAPRPARN